MRPVLTLAEKARCIWLYLIFREGHPADPCMWDLIRLTNIPFEEIYPPIYLIDQYCRAKKLPQISMLLDFHDKNRSIPTHLWESFHQQCSVIDWKKIQPVETREFEFLVPSQPRSVHYLYEKIYRNEKSPWQSEVKQSHLCLITKTLIIWQYLVFYAGRDVGPMTETQLEEMVGIPKEEFSESLSLIGKYCFGQHLLPLDSIVIEEYEYIRVFTGWEGKMLANVRKFPWFSICHPDRKDFLPYLED